jgi:hypothetical protein
MIIKLKKKHQNGILKVEGKADVKEVVIKEEIMHPEKESVHLMYKGSDTSGIIELSQKEIDMLVRHIKPSTHLIKDVKFFSDILPKKPSKKKKAKKIK